MTRSLEDANKKIEELTATNTSNYNRMMDYSEQNGGLRKTLMINDKAIEQMNKEIRTLSEDGDFMSSRINDLAEQVSGLQFTLERTTESLKASET